MRTALAFGAVAAVEVGSEERKKCMGMAHSVFRYQKLAYGWLDLYLLCFYITEHGSMADSRIDV